MLNGCLPEKIIVLSWCPVDKSFDSRHNCNRRTYKYTFPLTKFLDLEKMNAACEKLIGLKDFQNFCKINLSTASHHLRRIYSAFVQKSSDNLAFLEISASGFLYHQIRITMTILLQIGLGNEKVEIIDEFLDVEKMKNRAQLHLADDKPLILTECKFDQDLRWITGDAEKLTKHIQRIYWKSAVDHEQVRILINDLKLEIHDRNLYKLVSSDFNYKNYTTFSKRLKCPSFEEEVEKDRLKKERREFRKNSIENPQPKKLKT